MPPRSLPRSSSAWACDSSSCALLTRGQSGLLGKGAWRLDFSFRYTNQGLGLQGSQATDDVRVPKLDLELGRLRPAVHRETGEAASVLQARPGLRALEEHDPLRGHARPVPPHVRGVALRPGR